MKGIYKITNLITGSVYIGQSVDMEKRWQQHRLAAKKKQPSLLYAAMNRFGIENFSFESIEITDELDERERFWIAHYKEVGTCYNRKSGGQKAPPSKVDPNYVSPYDRRLHYQLEELRKRDENEKHQKV